MKLPSKLLFGLIIAVAASAAAQTPSEQNKILQRVSFDQNLGAQIPLNLRFRNQNGQEIALNDYFTGKPVILSLVYYKCPMLCTEALNGLVRTLRALRWSAGDQFNVVTVSFDPRETPSLAAQKRKTYLERYGRAGAENGWTFLTGRDDAIRRLTDAAGFHFAYDAALEQYAHSTGIVVLTPDGKVARYLYGVEYSAKDLRLALADSGGGKIGSPVDKIALYCYQYDPLTGTYGLRVVRVLRIAGILTAAFILAMILWMGRRRSVGGR